MNEGGIILIKNLKLFSLGLFVLLLIAACSSNPSEEEKVVSKDDFLKEFSAGLEKRWEYTEKGGDEEATKGFLLEAIDLELTIIEEFKDLKFEDDKLKELAISYINELKNATEALDSFGPDSFYEKWDEHYSKRTSLILKIDDNYGLPISEEYSPILDELKAIGQDVLNESDKNDELDKFINTIHFEVNQDQSDEYYKVYTAIVENTTNYNIKDFNASLKLIDADGVTVNTDHVYTSNWNKGEKVKLEFMTSDKFDKIEVIKDYIETD